MLRTIQVFCDVVLTGTLICAASIPLRLDSWAPFVFLTYPPRVAFFVVAVACGIVCLLRKQKLRFALAASVVVLCMASIDWGKHTGINTLADVPDELSVCSMNVHGQPNLISDYLKSQELKPDILSLQEVPEPMHDSLADSMPEYQFYSADIAIRTKHPGAFFTCVTGVKKSRFDTRNTQVHSAITGYRSFAIDLPAHDGSNRLAIINVHTTKALAFHAGVVGFFTETPDKARRHADERTKLEEWIAEFDGPVLLAGDFNAPSGTTGVRVRGTADAHAEAGSGALLTFPSALPVVGIDHVLGTPELRFTESRILADSFSDHRARFARFHINDTTHRRSE